jgi:hypothetical protein
MKALVRFGSRGVSSVTVGLSSVGPPPAFRISQVFATSCRDCGADSRPVHLPYTQGRA